MKFWEWFKNLFKKKATIYKEELNKENVEVKMDKKENTSRSTYGANLKKLSKIPKTSGVYLFLFEKQIMYIGQTRNFNTRLSDHTFRPKNKEWGETVNKVEDIENFIYGESYKENNAIDFSHNGWILFELDFKEEILNEAENYLLRKFSTKFNESKNGTVTRNPTFKNIRYVEYDGRGIQKFPKSISEIIEWSTIDGAKRGVVGVSGVIPGVMSYEQRRELQRYLKKNNVGISLSKDRKEEFKVWILGETKIGKMGLDCIDKTDYVVHLKTLLEILNYKNQ